MYVRVSREIYPFDALRLVIPLSCGCECGGGTCDLVGGCYTATCMLVQSPLCSTRGIRGHMKAALDNIYRLKDHRAK